MRLRTVLTTLVAFGALTAGLPAHADEVGFGTPDVDFRYNDGDIGVIQLAWAGLPSTHRSGPNTRPMNADCQFVIEASVGSSAITVDVVAYAEAGVVYDQTPPVVAAATGVTCTVFVGSNPGFVVTAAQPGSVAVASGRHTYASFQSPITLCSKPNVLWTDNVSQTATTAYCKTA